MKLPNPNSNNKFDRVVGDYGYRNSNTDDEEIVHIPTDRSNHTYYQPEMVMNPEGCEHEFYMANVGKREVECNKCHFETSFIPGINTNEVDGKLFFTLKKTQYLVNSL